MLKKLTIPIPIIVMVAITSLLYSCKDDYRKDIYASNISVKINISPSVLHFSADGGEKAVFVESNASWEVVENADWIDVSPSNGKENGTIVISIYENQEEKSRMNYIYIKVHETGIAHAISVEQSAHKNNRPEYVDMGLPSGTLWGSCNLGANEPFEYGDYYAYGEICPKYDYSRETYPYLENSSPVFDYVLYGESNHLKLPDENDVAFQKLGKGWHIPTSEDFIELRNSCSHKFVDNYGENKSSGYLFYAPNGNELFFPAAGCIEGIEGKQQGYKGYYRTSTMVMKNYLPNITVFYWKELITNQTDGGYFGYSVRAVYSPNVQ